MSDQTEKLPTTIKRKGLTYELVERNEQKALYRVMIDGKTISYELFRIIIQQPAEVKGIHFKKKERFPPDSAFGSWAWAFFFIDEDKALRKYNNLEPVRKRKQ